MKLRFDLLDTITDVNQGRMRKLKRSITELDEIVLMSVQGCEFQEADLHGSDGIQTYGSLTHVPTVKKMRFELDFRDVIDRLSNLRLQAPQERETTADFCPSDKQLVDRIIHIARHLRQVSFFRVGSDTYQAVMELSNFAVATRSQCRVRKQQAVVTCGTSWVAGRGPLADNGCLQRKLINAGGNVNMSQRYIDYSRLHVFESAADFMGSVSSASAASRLVTEVLDKLQSESMKENKKIGAVVVELMSGQDGRMLNPLSYRELVEYCASKRIALVVDEILTGLNCGSPFLHTHE